MMRKKRRQNKNKNIRFQDCKVFRLWQAIYCQRIIKYTAQLTSYCYFKSTGIRCEKWASGDAEQPREDLEILHFFLASG
jgi:hypothetical protein